MAVISARWDDVREELIAEWAQGEHLALFGQTGQGKTSLALALLEARHEIRESFVLVLAHKPRDPTLSHLGWPIVREWPPDYQQFQTRHVIYWPPYPGIQGGRVSRARFTHVLSEALQDFGWTIYADEVGYFTETLKMREIFDEIWLTGRSAGITLVGGSQRPVYVPRAMVTQSRWVVSFRVADSSDLKRLQEIGGSPEVPEIVSQLPKHHFLVWDGYSRQGVVSVLPAPRSSESSHH